MNKKFKCWRLYAPDGEGGAAGAAATGEASGSAAGAAGSTNAGAAAATGSTSQATQGAASTQTTASAAGEVVGYWPADWRAKASSGDEKVAERLGRYQSPEAVAKALIAAQNRISSGELQPKLGKNASPEEVKAWRAEMGIPEAADKYELNLGKNISIDESDKPLIDLFLKSAHETNQTPAQVNASVKAYYAAAAHMNEQRAARDAEIQQASEDALRTEWGNEFRKNINVINGLLDRTAGTDLKNNFLAGRLADGTPIGSSPEALKFLMGLALIDNPAGTVVPNTGGNLQQGLDDEIGRIEKTMKENRSAYNKDEKMQARYRELLGAREKLKERAA